MFEVFPSRVVTTVALGLTATLLLAGCVTRGKYRDVVAERDQLTEENQNLRRQTATVAGVAADLSLELRLRDRQLVQLEREQEELADEIEAWAMLGAIKMQLLADGLHITLPHDVLFSSGSVKLLPEGQKMLRELVAEIKQQPYQIAVLGFTDNVPVGAPLRDRFPSNWELAAARAASVVRLLQSEGVPASQLVAVSQGENQPIASNDTPEGRAQNRRIDVRLRPIVRD